MLPVPHHVPNRIPATHRRTVKAVSLEKDLLLFYFRPLRRKFMLECLISGDLRELEAAGLILRVP